MVVPASTLRRAARLSDRNVHPHAAGPGGAPAEGAVTLREKIEQEIHERGPIPFSRYMELCLYDPELGYYSRDVERFGKAGDFYTSSDVHAVFGRLLARQFEEIWRVLGSPQRIEILELGPGRGLFAQDVLDWSEKKFPDFFRALRYVLIERSPTLCQRIEATMTRHLRSGKAKLEEGKNGKGTTSVVPYKRINIRALAAEVPVLLFANEFFDALPVEIVSPQGALRIDSNNGRFVETWAPASADELEFLDRYSIHPEENERVEVPLPAQRHADELFAAVDHGFAVII